MFATYLRRELSNRKKQSIIIAIGMALAIALVILVNGVSAAVKDAETTALSSVNGVGTDITISKTAAPGTGNQKFAFGSGGSSSAGDGSTKLAQSTLTAAMGTGTYSASALTKAEAVDGVSAATATLSLRNSTFSGQIAQGSGTTGSGTTGESGSGAPSGKSGAGGSGPSSFNVDSFTVAGITPGITKVGPMSSTELSSGRYLKASDDGTYVTVVDASYAKSESLKVGSTLTTGGKKFTVVGIVKSTSSDSTTASNTYIPLDTAQKLADLDGKVSNIYVSAASAGDVATLKTALEKALPSVTVNTQADLASSVSGSLSTVSTLVSNLGTWLSLIVLAAAFLIAVLFTISGVGRRTREFGTLKAIGWSNGRIVRQVTGESLVNGLIGGAIGAVVGIAAIVVVNLISPTLSTGGAAAGGAAGGAGGPGGAGGAPGAAQAASSAATAISLHIPFTGGIVLIAVGLAVLGGLIAGAFGGWRAARLRPAEAFRSVA
ncbi:MAG TPA: ABC transporter permease [Humibacter sp.]|nr:ABC transporter permease [Humibacter sp.]